MGKPLKLKSNICIDGNGSTILAYKTIPTYDPNDPTATPDYNLDVITNANLNCDITDVTFKNLTFKGRYNETTAPRMDQCIKFDTGYPHMLKDFKFENVTFDGFLHDIHITNSTGYSQDIENLNWSINNCKFLKSGTPIMLKSTNGVEFTNSYFDGSLSVNKQQHCIYLSGSCYNITVDNCLFENSAGDAIHQHCADTNAEQAYNHDNVFSNLQIRNCNNAVLIGAPSKDIQVKNIVATNVLVGLKLINCKNVLIDNFNCTSTFYYRLMRKLETGIKNLGTGESGWSSIIFRGSVDADIRNSYFSTGGVWFYSTNHDKMLTGIGDKVPVDVNFSNCIFISTLSEHIPYEPESFLGVSTDAGDTPYYCYNIDFDDCQFFVNQKGRTKSMITLRGYNADRSHFNFNNCLVAYRHGNGSTSDSATMPNAYFIYPDVGTIASFNNTTFYRNKNHHTNSLKYGFVDKEVIYSEGDDETTIEQKIADGTIRCVVTPERVTIVETL